MRCQLRRNSTYTNLQRLKTIFGLHFLKLVNGPYVQYRGITDCILKLVFYVYIFLGPFAFNTKSRNHQTLYGYGSRDSENIYSIVSINYYSIYYNMVMPKYTLYRYVYIY